MCGFVGYSRPTGNLSEEREQEIIKSMADAIKHRGPDDEGFYIDDAVSLGFRRLSIIDLEHGKQPMKDPSSGNVLVFNGEIYNYKELRKVLIDKGYSFATDSDSEVILHGYHCYGEKILGHLRGMFAFVILDKQKGKLFGSRDHFGIKPFYYYKHNEQFIFGSEIKGLIKHPDFEKEFNELVLDNYLSMEYTADENTFFKNTYKLLPGHFFEYNLTSHVLDIRPYFNHSYHSASASGMSIEDQIEKAVEESVEAHLIADVEVGSFLSSGIDSSYILETAHEIQDIQSFSIGYKEEKYSELSYAQDFSKQIGVKNTSTNLSAKEYMDIVPKVQYHMDEPLSNPSAIPLYFLAKMASQHVKVVLSGEGADELFGGYNQYLESIAYSRYQKTPAAIRKVLADAAKKLPRIKGQRFLIRGAREIEDRDFRIDYVFSYKERKQLLRNPAMIKNQYKKNRKIFSGCNKEEQIYKMLYFDFHTWLPNDILLKADKMTMANSLELRVPFLDKKILRLASGLKPGQYVEKNRTKAALRKAANRKLPKSVSEKTKLGFPSPLAEWIRQEPFKSMILDAFHSEFARNYFNIDYLEALVEDHCLEKAANMRKIWSIYSLIIWYEQYFALNENNHSFA